MKNRHCHVSNSSSSSFIIVKDKLTKEQINMIINHEEIAKNLGLESHECPWNIKDEDGFFIISTTMDNFDMENYLTNHVKVKEIKEGPYQSMFSDGLYQNIDDESTIPIVEKLKELKESLKEINDIKDGYDSRIIDLEEIKEDACANKEFEDAADIRDEILSIKKLPRILLVEKFLEDYEYFEDVLNNAIERLED